MRPLAFAAVVGALWGAFSFWLFVDGHAPSGPTPFPQAQHYLIQAVLLPPLMAMAVLAGAAVAKRLLPESSRGSIAYAFAGCTGIFWLLPDVVAYASFGFEALAGLAPLLGALSAVASIAASTLLLRGKPNISDVGDANDGSAKTSIARTTAPGPSVPKALGTSLLAYLAFAFVLTTLLR